MYKVGVWGPGSMGLIALRGVIDHPQLQLVDLVVHSDVKVGRDAGELCGIAPVGVAATNDPAGMLSGDADVVVYAAAANLRPAEAIDDMVSILRAGKNVVSCSVVPLVFPDAVDATFTEPLRAAATAGGASFFTTGIDSGFANDVLPLVLSGVHASSSLSALPRCSTMQPIRTKLQYMKSSASASLPKPTCSRLRQGCSPSAGGRCCTSSPPGWA
jgi:4-hydroxy-tetrahydrodipicolinate reductase